MSAYQWGYLVFSQRLLRLIIYINGYKDLIAITAKQKLMKLCVIGGTGQQGYQQVLAGLEQGFEVVAVGQSRTLSRRQN